MQTANTTTANNQKQIVKTYKKWCIKAQEAEKEATAKGIEREKFPKWTAAENLAKNALISLNRITAMLLIFILITTATSTAQNATKGKDGNFYALAATDKAKTGGKETGKFFIDKDGKKYSVLESAKGKLFYIRTSKTGNSYKVYIKTESK